MRDHTDLGCTNRTPLDSTHSGSMHTNIGNRRRCCHLARDSTSNEAPRLSRSRPTPGSPCPPPPRSLPTTRHRVTETANRCLYHMCIDAFSPSMSRFLYHTHCSSRCTNETGKALPSTCSTLSDNCLSRYDLIRLHFSP